ncbi:hypothetical protein [Ideonella sp. YS5]|uniref:hypothetical protein n=1 Tax=Ideonella sp. YS5 TaxID=3453714 RepID=UPI003EEB4844
MQVRASSAWFASLVAVLVAIGTQALLEAIVPASFAEWQAIAGSTASSGTVYRAGSSSLWLTDAIIRLLSFILGGFVAGRLAGALSWRLISMLLTAAVLATVVQQFPGRPAKSLLVLWSLAGPVGVGFGAWVANAKRAAA